MMFIPTVQQCFHPSVKHLLAGSVRVGSRTIFKVGGHKCTSKKLEEFCDLNWQLCRHKH